MVALIDGELHGLEVVVSLPRCFPKPKARFISFQVLIVCFGLIISFRIVIVNTYEC